jgi:cytoskeletal protein RodZ
MGEPVVELGERELERIGRYVQGHLKEWTREQGLEIRSNREIELLERIVRVEEGLKNQAELMRQGFEQMEKRFELVDKRFSVLQWVMGVGFTILAALMGVFNFF